MKKQDIKVELLIPTNDDVDVGTILAHIAEGLEYWFDSYYGEGTVGGEVGIGGNVIKLRCEGKEELKICLS